MIHPHSSSISSSHNALTQAFAHVWSNKQIVGNWLLLAVVANVPADLSICSIFRLPHPRTASVFTYECGDGNGCGRDRESGNLMEGIVPRKWLKSGAHRHGSLHFFFLSSSFETPALQLRQPLWPQNLNMSAIKCITFCAT